MTKATGNSGHIVVEIEGNISHLSDNDRQILHHLGQAVQLINAIYLKQHNQDLTETCGVFDKTRGTNYYPKGATAQKIESYLKRHPKKRDGILSPFTVVGESEMGVYTTPYTYCYAQELERIRLLLRMATLLCDQYPLFQEFLYKRVYSFETNDYKVGDIAWIHANDAPFDLTIGPYESYDDELFGVKRDFQGVLGVTLKKETEEALRFQSHVSTFDTMLGERYGYKAQTSLTPMVVIDELIASGMCLYGFIPMAFNLPNDADVHQSVGSKKVFMDNVMRLKYTHITMSIAHRVLDATYLSRIQYETFFRYIVGHEISHGLSFRFEGKRHKEFGSPLEECKADVFGLLFLYYLAEQGVIDRDVAKHAVIVHLVDGLRQIRFGIDEAHAVGMTIQYRYFIDFGGLFFYKGKLNFLSELFLETLQNLGETLCLLSRVETVAYEKAQGFVARYGKVPDDIRATVEKLDGIAVDLNPVFTTKL